MPGSPTAFTIASNNYLALASTFARSYREHHPGAEVWCCIVDLPDPRVDYEELPFRVVFADQLDIPSFANFAFRFDVLELNTNVKPFVFRHLRDRHGLDRALYFDPDILVTDRLDGIATALDEHQAVLTPHLTAPLDNDFNPAEINIRQAGVYNLGFVGLRLDETTRAFLDWWCSRLHRHGFASPQDGLFVDQSWMEFTPCFLEQVAILRDGIYNVAYWNLPQRPVVERQGRWCLGDRPVGFFHFSGFDVADLHAVSRHQDRFDLDARPELRPLFEDYRRRLLGADHESLREIAYGYSRFRPQGPKIPGVARRLLNRVDPLGRRWPDPFAAESADSFLSWLITPLAKGAGRLNPLVISAWEETPFLSHHFRDPAGEDWNDYLGWLRSGGDQVLGIDPALYAHLTDASPEPPFTTPSPYQLLLEPTAERLLEGVDLASPGAHVAWLNQPVFGARSRPRLTTLALLLHARRSDLANSFPDPLDTDLSSFAWWFCNDGRRELGLHPSLVRPVIDSFPWHRRWRLRWRTAG